MRLAVVWVSMVWAVCLVNPALGAIDGGRFQQDLQVLSAPTARVVGSSGYGLSVSYVKSQIEALPGVELKTHSFSVLAPITRHATLSWRDEKGQQRSERIYPFWPASVRPNSTPSTGISGRLIYVKDGQYEHIPSNDLAGHIAVVEANSTHWEHAFSFGASALLVLGGEGIDNASLSSHDLLLPINLPRFFVPEGELANLLRAGEIRNPGTLMAKVDWAPTVATNLYALVPSRTPAPRGTKAIVIQAPLDSSGLVPDLSPGASQAVETAAVLALLRDLAADRPSRPVLVCFTSADTIQFRGVREMLMALAEAPRNWERELNWGDRRQPPLEQQLADVERDLKRARQIKGDPSALDAHKDQSLIRRIVQFIELDAALKQDDLFRLRLRERGESDIPQRERWLDEKRIELSALNYAIQQDPHDLVHRWRPSANPADNGTSRPPPQDSLLPSAREYLAATLSRLQRLRDDYAERKSELEARIALYQWLAQRLGLNGNPDPLAAERLLEVMIPLDLSDRASQIGPIHWGNFYRTSSLSQVQEWVAWFNRLAIAKERPEWLQGISPNVDLSTVSGLRSQQSYLAAGLPLASEIAQVWGVPAFSLVTLNDLRLRRDTPADVLQTLDINALVPQVYAAGILLRHTIDDSSVRATADYKPQHASIIGQVVSPAPGRPVPDLPREGFVATYSYVQPDQRLPRPLEIPWTMGVRRTEVAQCDAEGTYRFEGLLRQRLSEASGDYVDRVAVQVYRLAEDGSINAASDLGRSSGDIRFFADLRPDADPLRSLVFNCQEFPLVGLFDPRYLQDLGEVAMLDARRNAEPQRYNYVVWRRLMAGFVEPGQRTELLMRYGRTGNRLVLLNTLDNPQNSAEAEPRGFTPSELEGLRPLSIVTARDFHNLDSVRIREYAATGVRSDLLETLHHSAAQQIEEAEQAYRKNDAMGFVKLANGAWAAESRVYQATQELANDVIRGAIFLLLLCIPFSFCMERLLIASTSIYRQIAGGAAIFTLMAGGLASFHPAFRISTSPLIIILAFAILFMSLAVIWVLYGKFNSELKRLSTGKATPVTTSFARASVIGSAVLLGIANMRRRKFRTILTSLTIVLITFALLCFTSSTHSVGVTTIPTGAPRRQPGLLLRQSGFAAIPTIAADNLRAVLARFGNIRSDIPFHHALVQHWWVADPQDRFGQLYLSAGTSLAPVAALLGLSPGESSMSAVGEVVPGFERLEKGDGRVIYLSEETSKLLTVIDAGKPRNIRAGDNVRVGGIDLNVGGIYNSAAFDQKVKTLAGSPLTPLNFALSAGEAAGARRSDDRPVDSAGSLVNDAANYQHLPASRVAIVPVDVARLFPGAALREVSVRLADQSEVTQLGNDLAQRYAVPLYGAFDDGIHLISAASLTTTQGGAMVAVPLAIAGLIIFNTMMGSIAERGREIHVYTSLGLAPLHVGALFLAEAMTYGLIGAVFGYVIGQGVGKALNDAGWLGSVTLNYSGTSAMLTLSLILLVVLVSALVPARLASRLASPSSERRWEVPNAHNGRIVAELPFTINRAAAEGVLAFLFEFFEAHQEGTIGRFSAGPVELFTFADDRGMGRALRTVVWLTPFDLGVRQRLTLLIHPSDVEQIYQVRVTMDVLSGEPATWRRLNRPFLAELRRQFLQWRSLTPERVRFYIDESGRLFERGEDHKPDLAEENPSPLHLTTA